MVKINKVTKKKQQRHFANINSFKSQVTHQTQTGALLPYLAWSCSILTFLIKFKCSFIRDNLFSTLQLLSHRCNTASVFLFHRCPHESHSLVLTVQTFITRIHHATSTQLNHLCFLCIIRGGSSPQISLPKNCYFIKTPV